MPTRLVSHRECLFLLGHQHCSHSQFLPCLSFPLFLGAVFSTVLGSWTSSIGEGWWNMGDTIQWNG